MCGIVGTVNLPLAENDCALLAHRGPDGSGLARFAAGRHEVTLGHRRLAILDLSPAGAQPMRSEDGKRWITFNGEIYNHQDLRRALPEIQFRGHSDTESVLYAVARGGIQAAAGFNGIFAFGYVDAERGKLYLARDPFGVKPLYYCQPPGGFAFASEIRALRRYVPEAMDAEVLAEVLRLRYAPSPDTLYRGIRKVRPGHVVEVDLGGDEIRTSECPLEGSAFTASRLSLDEACARYGELLESAVRRQLMSDVEVGILLSGGVDSALVARAAAAKSSYRMKAFTVGFEGRDEADETREAAESAAFTGTEPHVVRIGFEDFLDGLDRCVDIIEEPLATTSVIPMFHLAKLASSRVKVVLSGQGADEPLGGYRRYQAELLRRHLPPWTAKGASALMGAAGVKKESWLRGAGALEEREDADRFLRAYEVFGPTEISKLAGLEERKARGRILETYERLRCSEREGSAGRMMAVDLRMNLADDLLLYTDKITMHHSLECRVPMLDLELVRFVESLPVGYRVRLGRTKIIHKRYARTVLPRRIVDRKKKGFLSPTARWFKEEGAVRERLLGPGTRFAGTFDLAEVGKVLDEHARGFDRQRQIFLLLGLHRWLEGLTPQGPAAKAQVP